MIFIKIPNMKSILLMLWTDMIVGNPEKYIDHFETPWELQYKEVHKP